MLVRSPQLLLLSSIVLIIFGIISGFIIFPKVLEAGVKSQMNLAPGSQLRPFYEKQPFYFHFLAYVFNCTNKEEVIQGKKPKLEEIGPYFFEEWKEKFDLFDNETEDSLKFHYKNTYIFRPDLSGNLTGDETIVIPHPMIVAIFLASNIDRKPMISRIQQGVNNIFHNPTDAFYTGRAMDVLFYGVEYDCSSSDPITSAICTVLGENRSVRKIDDDHFSFTILGGLNGTDMGEMKTSRGKKNYKDVGRVLSINGEPEFDTWNGDECNAYKGTDATILPPLVTPEDGLYCLDPVVCRSFRTAYTNRRSTVKGIPVHIFELDLSDEANIKPCYCRTKNTCPPHGAFDLFSCTGAPMIATLPHFYKAEQLLEGVESGLSPNKTFHELYVHLEIVTGAPISAVKRMQFNWDMKPIPEIEVMKNMPEILFPFCWFEESVIHEKLIVDRIKMVYWGIYFVTVLKWSCVLMGAFGILGTGAWVIIAGENWSTLFLNPIKHEANEESKPDENTIN